MRGFKQEFGVNQLQARAIQIPGDEGPFAPVTLRSTKPPAGTTTPETVHAAPGGPGATEQVSAVFTMLPGLPDRNVTVIVCACCEKTFSCVAVHPDGTQVRTDANSAVFPVELFTE